MILAIDIGGTKTLLACFDNTGHILKEVSFSTPDEYDDFLNDLKKHAARFDQNFTTCCMGVPGLLDRKAGVVRSLGNLPWIDRPIAHDVSKIFNDTPVYIENDSKLAGLGEVSALDTAPKRVLYITVSTGIGGALLVDGRLSTDMIDMEIGKSPLNFAGDVEHWENFASGRAFFESYGIKGDDTDDPKIWQNFVQERLGPGIVVACSYLQVDTIIFGGGLGHHAPRFRDYLAPYIDERLHPIVKRPKQLLSATYGKNGVIYGCFEYAKNYHR